MKDHALWYGSAAISPEGPIAAGSCGTWALTYTVGRYGMDNGGRIRVLFRYAWDGGTPQTVDPAADNYVTATTTNPNARATVSFLPKGGRRPWLPCLQLEIKDDSLAEGDQVTVVFGDTSGGSRGHVAQTFVESDFRWLTEVECFETGSWVELERSPVTPIVAAAPARLVALAPSEALTGEPFSLAAKCEDAYGNPTSLFADKVEVALERLAPGGVYEDGDTEAEATFAEADCGIVRLDGLTLSQPGTYRFRLAAADGSVRAAVSNPIAVLEQPISDGLRHYWGDLHAQFNNALGTGSVEEGFRYARDAGDVSFVGHQPNDFQFSQAGWDEIRETAKRMHEPGRFIPFVGYEWSGTTPAGGDRNVHFLGDDGDLHRSSHWHIADKSDEESDRYPLDDLFREFAGRSDVLIVPHIGGRRCDITRYHDPELEPAVEICSCHGRFEWLLHEALDNGYTVGVIGGSDDHTGRPGAAYATSHSFGTRGGLAGIYARELTREGIFAALRDRHTYATTGERMRLLVTTADGRLMGDAWVGGPTPSIRVQAAGTKPLASIDIMRNHDLAYSHSLFEAKHFRRDRVRLEWGGARLKGRGRHTDWSGQATIVGGTIGRATAYAFDHPKQGIASVDGQRIGWTSTTSGDHDGVILDLENAGPGTTIHFQTALIDEKFTLEQLQEGPIRRECGGVGQYALFGLHPVVPGPLAIDFTWQDPEPQPGRNAYWVRVVQEDGETAWSSPLYYKP
jgi:hypothetical protein